ncbi:ephrin type-A receptor 2 [Embiotoca jacksoni]|uniref:ephrin type-A receptor 2 n=1 Tax=Embiotoca jacksoni TaxID=100190 RepID=UPI0037040876
MSVCNSILYYYFTSLVLLWMFILDASCDTQHQAEEVEIFHSDKQAQLAWTSKPLKEWNVIRLRVGGASPVPVLQACGQRMSRTILSRWMERKNARYLLMDIAFAQEEESSGQLSPLQVHISDSDTPITTLRDTRTVLDLQTSKPFRGTHNPNQLSSHLNRSVALSLGPVSSRGFQIAFSYSGTCVFVTSIRLYYRMCPDIVSDLVSFGRTGAGSGPLLGSCVERAVKVSPPERECNVDGVWGPQRGRCTCEAGHQVRNNTCQACRIGYYKATNESGECRMCPANTKTHREGSERCDCQQGFSQLPSDPNDLGCTKAPSAPVNLTTFHYNDSVLMVTWDPPYDRGGRQEIKYSVKCEKEAGAGNQWEACVNDVVFLPEPSALTHTSVNIMGLNPQDDYRLSVQAWNDISALQGKPHASTAVVTIHRWKVPPAVITVSPPVNISDEITPPQPESRFSIWLTIGVLFGILMLIAVISIVVCALPRNYTKLRLDQEVELLPMNPEMSFRHPQTIQAAPQQSNMAEGVVQLLGGVSGRLLDSLKEVLVERSQLTLGKEMGKGEFGSVHQGVFAPQEGVVIEVAVKMMRVGIHCEEDLHEFLREAEIMKNFDHENVVRLLGVTLQRDQDSPLPIPLVVLPYMKHRDLRRFLIATRYGDIPMFIPHQTLLRFIIDIAAGMDYLSSQGCLHRDLAARNCMLGDDLRVCVADFGLSKNIYSNNYYRQKVAIRLPIKWMAMESLSECIYTSKTDVWSYGVTMWEIVSRGRIPYPGVHNHELLDLLLSGHRLKPPEDCDQKLYEVMRSCWDREATRRPAFRELVEALKGLLSELPVLETSQEANYINQGLGVAAAVAAAGAAAGACEDPQTESGRRLENIYLPAPVEAAATARDEDVEIEDGYLKCIPDLVDKVDYNH